ncbi:MAG TPA: type II toxin-antitoxin system RelE/ParE family toxin [Sphingomonas sp.]|nr:type II toxin-antitoxin system RelE/ParE family toxin [Sphingomonas sp.]
MKVVFPATAERDLDYIAEDDPARAFSFVRELRGKALGLAENPLAGTA